MNPIALAVFISAALFLAMTGAQLAGHRLGRQRIATEGDKANSGARSVEAAVFGLLGLLVAFTFSGASTRFEHRRDLALEHINALGTAWMRLDLLPPEDQGPVRSLFRDYVDGVYAASLPAADTGSLAPLEAEMNRLQAAIWSMSVTAAARSGENYVPTVLLPALNDMFDLTASRLYAMRIHVQPEVVGMLIMMAILAAFIAGNGQAELVRPDLVHMILFAAVVSLWLYAILDFEFPRLGLITQDSGRGLLQAFRATLGQD